jgi:hypothetical protein
MFPATAPYFGMQIPSLDTRRRDLLRTLEGELVSPVAILDLTAQGEHEAALLIDRILSGLHNVGDRRQSSR